MSPAPPEPAARAAKPNAPRADATDTPNQANTRNTPRLSVSQGEATQGHHETSQLFSPISCEETPHPSIPFARPGDLSAIGMQRRH